LSGYLATDTPKTLKKSYTVIDKLLQNKGRLKLYKGGLIISKKQFMGLGGSIHH